MKHFLYDVARGVSVALVVGAVVYGARAVYEDQREKMALRRIG